MATKRKKRTRAGSSRRDSLHREGGEWTTLTVPAGVNVFQPKAATFRLDIVPYVVGEGNPYADTIGELYYERTFWVHANVGPNNRKYVCLKETFGKPCPICEYWAKAARDPDVDSKEADNYKPKERQMFLVHDRKEPEKGVQLLEISNFCFGKLLDKLRRDAEADEIHISEFDDCEKGSLLKVGFSDEDGGGFTFPKAYNIDFKPRASGLPEGLIDHGICLDELLKEIPYDKLKALFHQEEATEGESDDDEPPKKSGKKKSPPADDDEEEEKPAVKQGKKKSPPPVDDDDDEWDDDFDEPEEKPVAKRGKKKSPPSEDDDDDEWDE